MLVNRHLQGRSRDLFEDDGIACIQFAGVAHEGFWANQPQGPGAKPHAVSAPDTDSGGNPEAHGVTLQKRNQTGE